MTNHYSNNNTSNMRLTVTKTVPGVIFAYYTPNTVIYPYAPEQLATATAGSLSLFDELLAGQTK